MKKHIYLKFALLLLVGAVVGGLLGGLSSANDKRISSFFVWLSGWLVENAVWIMIPGLLGIIVAAVLYSKAKATAQKAEQQEELYEQADALAGKGLVCVTASMVWNFCAYGFCVSGFATEMDLLVKTGLCLLFLVLTLIFSTLLQHKIVKLCQKINPEKKGNVFDLKFNQEWYASCDEAERKIIGEASYFCMKKMQGLYMIAFLLLIMTSIAGQSNALSFLMLGVLWMSHQMLYMIKSVQLEHPGKKQ